MQDLSLVRIEEVVAALESATTVQEVKSHIDAAKAAEVYAKQAKVGKDLELKVFQYIKKAERKLGEMLAAAKAAGQIGHGSKSTGENQYKSGVVPKEDNTTFTLEEAGISRKLSSRAQKLAAVPKEEFDKAIAEGKEPKAMKPKVVPGSGRRGRVTPKLDEARGIVRGSIEAGNPVSPHKLEQQHGISHVTFDMAITAELARKQALSEPTITPDTLSLTAQQKLELAIRQHKAKLDREFHAAVNLRVQEFLENTIGPILRKEQAEARRITNSRKGVMTRKDYIKIRACLHPDSIIDPERKPKYEDAFKLFEGLEKLVLNEKESPTEFFPVPVTPADWEAWKKQATERKRAEKRNSKGGTNIKKSGNA